MKRILVAAVVLSALLLVALAIRVRAQEAALEGPSSGSGVVEGTAIDLASRIGGRLKAIHVQRGAAVKAGDVVAELECSEPEARLAEVRARVAGAEAQVDAAKAAANATNRSRGALKAQAQAAAAQVAVLESQRATAKRELERVEVLGTFAAPQRKDTLEGNLDTLAHQQQAADAQRLVIESNSAVTSAQGDAANATARASSGNLEAARALEKVAQLSVDECSIRAVTDGVVDEVFYEAGELTAPGAVVVRVVDLAHLTATFYVPNAEVGSVKTGGSASVVADAWPEQSFTGVVTTVGLRAEFTPRTVQTRSDRDRLVYPVEVRLDNVDGHLRPGMPVQVTLGAPAAAGGQP